MMSQLCSMDPDQLVLTATTIALTLSRLFQGDDLNILSSIFSAVGDMLALVAARSACTPAETEPPTPSCSQSEQTPPETADQIVETPDDEITEAVGCPEQKE